MPTQFDCNRKIRYERAEQEKMKFLVWKYLQNGAVYINVQRWWVRSTLCIDPSWNYKDELENQFAVLRCICQIAFESTDKNKLKEQNCRDKTKIMHLLEITDKYWTYGTTHQSHL